VVGVCCIDGAECRARWADLPVGPARAVRPELDLLAFPARRVPSWRCPAVRGTATFPITPTNASTARTDYQNVFRSK
jgi:hypothetical protein